MACYFLVALMSAAVLAEGAKVTPVEKVTELLKGLQAKITEEGKKEAAAYDKFACFCKEQATEKQAAIAKEKKKIAGFSAEIKLDNAEDTALNNRIGALGKEVTTETKDMSDDRTDREKQHDKYLADAKDLIESIRACAGAIQSFKDAKSGLKDAKTTNLLEVHQKLFVTASRIFAVHPDAANLMQEDLEEEEKQGPKYAFQGNAIIASLETLLANFKKMKASLDMDESENLSAFEKKRLGNNNEIKVENKERQQKTKQDGIVVEEVSDLNVQKSDEVDDKTADEKFLVALTADCEEKARVFDQRSTSRSDELVAMTGAIAELENGVKKNEGVNKNLVDLQTPASFLQLSTLQKKSNDAVKKVQALLAEAAENLDSSVLKGAAVRVQVAADNFVKVRGLINDLITKLKDDAAAESNQKAYCDKSMGEATTARDENKAKQEKAKAMISTLNAKIQTLNADLAELAAGIAENAKAVNEMTELRGSAGTGKGWAGQNAAAIAGATEGKAAVDRALNLLSKFYGDAALVQVKATKYTPPNADKDGKTLADGPQAEAAEYKGAQAESKGVMGMLEVISSDFDRTINTVTTNEAEAQKGFTADKKGLTDDTATKTKTQGDKKGELATAKDELNTQKGLAKDATDLVTSSNELLDGYKVQCVEGEETYEERVAARKKEIDALKDATELLDSWKNN